MLSELKKLRQARLETLNPDPENANDHPEDNIAAIKGSLIAHGQVLPLVYSLEGDFVVGGNGTLRAMVELGWEKCAVVDYPGPVHEARALGVRLNQSARLAQYNPAGLAKTLAFLQEHGYHHLELGFQTDDLNTLLKPVNLEARSWSFVNIGADDDDDSPARPAEDPGTPKVAGSGTPVIQYNLIFDDEAQQKRWFQFIKWLKRHYEGETMAERLDEYLLKAMTIDGEHAA